MDYDVAARANAAKKLAPKSKGGKGRAVIIRRPGGVYDPKTMTTSDDDFDQNVGCAEFAYDRKAVDGVNIIQGDKNVMMAALTLEGEVVQEPDVNWLYVIQGEPERLIVNVEPFGPAGVPIYYTLQVRGK